MNWKAIGYKVFVMSCYRCEKKINYPIIGQQTINAWLTKLIFIHENNQFRQKEFLRWMESIFDITMVVGTWLCHVNEELCHCQVESDGKVRFTTHNHPPKSAKDPSKRQCMWKKGTSPYTYTIRRMARNHNTDSRKDG